MAVNLQTANSLSTTEQYVKDVSGNASNLAIGTNGRTGIGTAAPSQTLQVEQSGSGTIARFIKTSDRGIKLGVDGADNDTPYIVSDIQSTLKLGMTNVSGSLDFPVQIYPSPNATRLAVNGRIIDKTGYLAPVGAIMQYAGSSAPSGWLLCDGSTIARSTFPDLFAIVGTTYGEGDGLTTFRLPDMRGVFPKGAGQQGTASFAAANYAGTLGTYTQDQFQGHHHTPSVVYSGAQANSGAGVFAGNSINPVAAPISDGTNGTPRTGATTEPASLGLNYIIKT